MIKLGAIYLYLLLRNQLTTLKFVLSSLANDLRWHDSNGTGNTPKKSWESEQSMSASQPQRPIVPRGMVLRTGLRCGSRSSSVFSTTPESMVDDCRLVEIFLVFMYVLLVRDWEWELFYLLLTLRGKSIRNQIPIGSNRDYFCCCNVSLQFNSYFVDYAYISPYYSPVQWHY